jgi:zinc/manganese transport system substrate-binding protein
MSKQTKIILCFIAGLLFVGLLTLILHNIYKTPSIQSNKVSGTNTIQVVAAENFWGSLISQLGGNRVNVTSIVSDPNADPHEYESDTNDARLFATANYVILNGAGYDSWADNLLSANSNPNQKVLKVADLLGKKEGDNPHFWYSSDYVNQVIAKMEGDLISIDPSHADYYKAQYALLQTALAPYQTRIVSIKQQFSGTKVSCTEDIFVYLSQSTGLDLISPPAFIQAVGEANDPPANSIVEFQNQLKNKEPKILVYNQQTVTPVTESMKKVAADNGIPVVGITETIQPPDTSFQDWMNAQLIGIENALNAGKLGK